MNSDGDTSNTSCLPPVQTRFSASERNTAPLHEDEEELECDRDTVDDNQDDSELYLVDDDDGDLNELAAETSSLASSDSSGFVWSEQGTITAVRVRPMLPSEKKNGYRSIVDMSANNDGLVTRIVNPTALPPLSRSIRFTSGALPLMQATSATDSVDFPAQFTQEFRFDYSFWSSDRSYGHQLATQSTIYDDLGVLALQTVLQGHNCSVFAYGQAGAGKTFTMMGNSGERTSMPAIAKASNSSAGAASDRLGLIPRICQGLFAELDEGKRSGSSSSVVMSYLEIYDERVYDLLSQATTKKSLKVREHPEEGAFAEKARRVHVTSSTQVLELIDEGNRSRSATSMHNTCRSPRSHTVLILSLTRNTPGSSSSMSETPRKTKLCLVDLAGSERADHNGASGLRLREAASVNRSLATLADVVGALAKRKLHRSMDGSQRQKTFVPYRNSVLTRLLKECLGGRAKTIMIGAISPCCAHYEESIATLRYIERARSVYSTPRLQGNPSGDTRFLDDVNEIKSSLCASDDCNLSCACSQAPERQDDCLDDASCDEMSDNAIQQEEMKSETSSRANAEEGKTPAAGLIPVSSDPGQAAQQALMKSVHLLNLAAIRRRSQTLQTYRALNHWRKLVSTDTKRAYDRDMKPGVSKQSPPAQQTNGQKAGCPPLHTRSPTAESKRLGRVQDVVAAVVTTDAICCSVVQDFLFPHDTSASKISSFRRSSTTTSASLLELLASSSEFDRPDFLFDIAGDCSTNEHQLDELASPEIWCHLKQEEGCVFSELDLAQERPVLEHGGDTPPLLSPEYQDESSAYSALSLCVDSIDLARRALGPGMRNLLCQDSVSGNSVECELLRYLDKRFIVVTRHLEQLMVGFRSKPSLTSFWKSSESLCEALETMIGEFCLQIIAKLCDQLPSASSACVAGRAQLETQLEHFGDRLKQHLLPEMATVDNNCEANEHTHAALLVATELLVMTERIKLVWSFTGHKKRERLLKRQAMEAATINDRKMAAKIAVLEERNAELSAQCDVLAATSSRLSGLGLSNTKLTKRMPTNLDDLPSSITLEQLELEYDETSEPENHIGVKLAVEVARTRGVQARNDELLYRFATLSRALAAASARVTALEAENARLSSRSDLSEHDSAENSTPLLTLSDRVDVLQTELENSRCQARVLEDQVAKLHGDSLVLDSELKSVSAFYSREKEARASKEAELVSLRIKADAEIQELRNLLSAADARATKLAAAEDKEEQRWHSVNVKLIDTQNWHGELSVSLTEAKAELRSALERACRAERENVQHMVARARLENLKELAEMFSEDLMSKYSGFVDHVSRQAETISACGSHVHLDKRRLQELEMQFAAVTQDKEEYILLLSQTEEALASALDRENALQRQLKASSAKALTEANRLRGELHEATVEIASLREELIELLDHSTLQSSTIEALKSEQTEVLERVRELELERDEAVLQCQDTSEQKERACEVAALHAQHCEENLSRLERQQEIQRQESMAVHETLQRQTETFLKLQTQQHAIKMDYCSTIRDLKAQVETLSAASRASDENLAAKTIKMEAARSATKTQILTFTEQAHTSESLVLEQRATASNLMTQLQDYRVELAASTRRWVQAETQSELLRVCITQLNHFLTEAKETCLMQLADVESSQLTNGRRQPSTQSSSATASAVSEDVRSVDAWFDEVISGNKTTADFIAAQPTAEFANATESSKARDEDYAARSSLLKTLTDLSALTTELLVVCESSDADSQSDNSSAQDADEHNGTREDVDLPLNHYRGAISCNKEEGGEPQIAARREEKVPYEIFQLRKIVVKLKEALDAKDDMLLYLDGKVRRLEQFAQ